MNIHIYSSLVSGDNCRYHFDKICFATTIRSLHILESSLEEVFLPNSDADSSRRPNDQKMKDELLRMFQQ